MVPRRGKHPWKRRLFGLSLLLLVWLLCSGEAWAGALSDRLARYPDWRNLPPTQPAVGDLVYPSWMAGVWEMTSTLEDQVAPMAPDLVTPGFEGNRQFWHQPVTCTVRFVSAMGRTAPGWLALPRPAVRITVSDRAFNGLSLARAYLGEGQVLEVEVDPQNPNRQWTVLQGDRQLISTVTARATETPAPDQFLTSELFEQIFRGSTRPYLNRVETTTAYRYQPGQQPPITADQVTATYLSPQDPDYFKAPQRPVALYRYRLAFRPAQGVPVQGLQ